MAADTSIWPVTKLSVSRRIVHIILNISAVIIFNPFSYGQAVKNQLPRFNLSALTSTYSKNYLASIFDKKISDTVQIVGLGEVSHGGYEPMAFKANLIRYLIESKGYRKVLFEFSDIGDIRAMRNYLTHQNTNDTSYINKWVKNGTFINAFASVLPGLLKWIKQYNDNHPKDMVQIMGFDIRAEQLVINYVLNKYIIPDNYKESQLYVYQLNSGIPDADKIALLNKWFTSNQPALRAKLAGEDFNWLSFYIHNVVNSLNYLIRNSKSKSEKSDAANLFRDSVMSENVRYLNANSKSIIWAHNGHIIRAEKKYMGNYLDQYFKGRYYVIATDFSKFAAVDVTNQDTTQNNSKKYVTRIFKSGPTTAAYNIQDKYGISEGIFFRQDLINMNIKENVNVIDVGGLHVFVPEYHNLFDALVVFSIIYPTPK
ncbi:erythromycin esterase family protein [Mucilaginibacter sp. UR6-11]|uniref:erythromycin esterase family protein n=1 Tax=Mucilaginibacter sp. UR6-11 TaxID=1435644 RepID=UPI001E2D68F7|nr:erythromycin esterase family protein [Mucilaginibacter sp. UR6-11]MCC8427016.1 erythromycin esterase family protein [Mucilaginibacter sp. UR6-11]